jgi:hypothetical protein
VIAKPISIKGTGGKSDGRAWKAAAATLRLLAIKKAKHLVPRADLQRDCGKVSQLDRRGLSNGTWVLGKVMKGKGPVSLHEGA